MRWFNCKTIPHFHLPLSTKLCLLELKVMWNKCLMVLIRDRRQKQEPYTFILKLKTPVTSKPWWARFIIVLERLKEVRVCFLILSFTQMHLSSTFSDHAHNQWVGYGRLNVQRLFIQCLQKMHTQYIIHINQT